MLSLKPSGKGVCSNFIHFCSVSNRLMFLNLTEEFSSYEKVQVGKDQEKTQSEKDSHSKNRGGKKPK